MLDLRREIIKEMKKKKKCNNEKDQDGKSEISKKIFIPLLH